MASSARPTLTHDRDASSVRPRNRRLASVESGNDIVSREPSTIRGTARLASGTSTPLRDASPLPTHRLDVAPAGGRRGQDKGAKNPVGAGAPGLGLINGSWATTWGNVQDLAAGWISGNKASAGSAGIIAEREAALIAARTASVLESHDGVNGGLDVAGRYKLRTSDELPRQTSAFEQPEETLVYIHHVKPTDTHVGVILKYGCRDEAFKKLNGLWSRDSISTRKWHSQQSTNSTKQRGWHIHPEVDAQASRKHKSKETSEFSNTARSRRGRGGAPNAVGRWNATSTLPMPICIECRHPVKTLWTEYSGAGGAKGSGGHNIRLTVCHNCGNFCDKYVEHDFVIMFIDLVLIKPQPSIIRLGVLLLLFDVYLTWARIEKNADPSSSGVLGRLAEQPILLQYIFFRKHDFLPWGDCAPLLAFNASLSPQHPNPNFIPLFPAFTLGVDAALPTA
ncbi:unnamed protein product [Parascedosporium putredinis]|uniref:Protein ARV n=1 Tax=Parascedosporium putredinis TaxID=1442378 RepID=A0A9P1HAE0_9PEZI|nr:unnamed protein product [Parascedosporium putredinis]CAI8004520.1 unnamed protein product [Parascedosporium putredinis]